MEIIHRYQRSSKDDKWSLCKDVFFKIETDSKTELEFTYWPKAMKMPFNVHILDSFSQR